MSDKPIIKALLAIFLVMGTAVTTYVISIKISGRLAVAPTSPSQSRAAMTCPSAEACPYSKNPNLLINCTPPESGNNPAESLCSSVGRKEDCGGRSYCCPSAGGSWTTDMTACPTACVPSTWTPDLSTICVGVNTTQTSNCGTTRTLSGTKVCCTDTTWTPNQSTICTGTPVTQISNCGMSRQVYGTKNCACVPDGTITCSPDCPTVCGKPASTIATCKDSCTKSTTKQCAATESCVCTDTNWSPDPNQYCPGIQVNQQSNCGRTRMMDGTKSCSTQVTISQVAYRNESINTSGQYHLAKEIKTATRNQILVYAMEITNSGEGTAFNVNITDALTGPNQNQLIFMDAEQGCTYSSGNRTISCNNITLGAGAVRKFSFRVRVGSKAINGRIIRNTAKVSYGGGTRESSTELLISSKVGCNEYCTVDAECISGLKCDSQADRCRKPICLTASSCICPTPVSITTLAIKTSPTATPASMITATPIPTPTLMTEPFEIPDEIFLPTMAITETPMESVATETLTQPKASKLPLVLTGIGALILGIVVAIFVKQKQKQSQ